MPIFQKAPTTQSRGTLLSSVNRCRQFFGLAIAAKRSHHYTQSIAFASKPLQFIIRAGAWVINQNSRLVARFRAFGGIDVSEIRRA